MGKDLKDFAIGSVLVAASFLAAPIPVVGQYVATALFVAGAQKISSVISRALINERAEGIKANVTSTQAPVPLVYGTARVGLKIVDSRSVDTDDIATADPNAIIAGAENNQIHVRVGALALGGEGGDGINDVRDVRFNNDSTPAIGNPVVESANFASGGIAAKFANHCRYLVRLGSDSQTAPQPLIDHLGWTNEYDGVGIAYIAVALKYDEEVFKGGYPRITATVEGVKVYDPRDATWKFSNNPALVILDYLTSKRYGAGYFYPERDGGDTDLSEIDEASFIDVANYCEDLVSVPGGTNQPRFTFDGVVDTSRSIEANLAEMKYTCRSELVWQGGKVRLVTRRSQSPVSYQLTEDNIIGEWEVIRKGSVPNIIEGTFIDDRDGEYVAESVTWPLAGDSTFLDNDNGVEHRTEVELPYVTNYYRALHIIMVLLREERQDVLVSVVADQSALELEVGDVVELTHSYPGWDQKQFWVLGMALTPDGNVRLALWEYDSSIYNLASLDARDTLPGTNLPNPETVAPPSNVTATSSVDTAVEVGSGLREARIRLEWDASPDPFLRHYQVQIKKSSDSAWETAVTNPLRADTQVHIPGVLAGESYDLRIRAVNRLGFKSAWVEVSGHEVEGFPDPRIENIGYSFNLDGELIVTVRTVDAGSVRIAADSTRPTDLEVDAAPLHVVDADGVTSVNLGSGFTSAPVVAGRAYRNADGSGVSGRVTVSEVFKVQYIEAGAGTIGGWAINEDEISTTGFVLSSSTKRMLIGAATAVMTGIGIFAGDAGDGTFDFRVGDPSGHYFHWDESEGTLTIAGEFSATTGEIGGWTITENEITSGNLTLRSTDLMGVANPQIRAGAATAPLTGAGVFIGLSGGEYQARLGDPAGDYFLWNGSTLILNAEIIDSSNLVDGAVITSKLDDDAVTEAKILDAAITAGKIGPNAVITEKIANLAVEWSKLGDRAVSATKLFIGSFDNLVMNGSFEQFATTNDQDGWRIIQGVGQSGMVATIDETDARTGIRCLRIDSSASTIGAGTGTAGHLLYGDVSGQGDIAVNTGDRMYAEWWVKKAGPGTSSTVQCAWRWYDASGSFFGISGSFTYTPTEEWQRCFTPQVIVPEGAFFGEPDLRIRGTADEDLLVDDVYARRMVEGSIIVDGTLTARHIEVGTLTGDLLVADTITGDKIAARTIGTEHLFVGSFDNLAPNPGFEQDGGDGLPAEWHLGTAAGGAWSRNTAVSARSGNACLAYDATGQNNYAKIYHGPNSWVEVAPGDLFYAEVWIRNADGGTTNTGQIRLEYRDSDGVFVSGQSGNAVTISTTWQKSSVQGTVPSGATRLDIVLQVPPDGLGGVILFDDVYMRRRLTGELIVDGTLTAQHIESLSFSGKTAEFDTGSIGGWLMTASTLHSGAVTIDAANERITIGSATAPLTGVGVFMGGDGDGGYDFRVGDPNGHYIHWDDSEGELTINGIIASDVFAAGTATFLGSLDVLAGSGTSAEDRVVRLSGFNRGLITVYGPSGPGTPSEEAQLWAGNSSLGVKSHLSVGAIGSLHEITWVNDPEATEETPTLATDMAGGLLLEGSFGQRPNAINNVAWRAVRLSHVSAGDDAEVYITDLGSRRQFLITIVGDADHTDTGRPFVYGQYLVVTRIQGATILPTQVTQILQTLANVTVTWNDNLDDTLSVTIANTHGSLPLRSPTVYIQAFRGGLQAFDITA